VEGWAPVWQGCRISLALAEHPTGRKIYIDILELFGFPQVVEMSLRTFSNSMRPHFISLFRFELL
jgi:hypothetical protein